VQERQVRPRGALRRPRAVSGMTISNQAGTRLPERTYFRPIHSGRYAASPSLSVAMFPFLCFMCVCLRFFAFGKKRQDHVTAFWHPCAHMGELRSQSEESAAFQACQLTLLSCQLQGRVRRGPSLLSGRQLSAGVGEVPPGRGTLLLHHQEVRLAPELRVSARVALSQPWQDIESNGRCLGPLSTYETARLMVLPNAKDT
jgi:hypothetical protein